jgi:hypothetical protein
VDWHVGGWRLRIGRSAPVARRVASWICGRGEAWRVLELRRPWLAGAIIGSAVGLGYTVDVVVAPPFPGEDVVVTAGVGGATAFSVSSILRGYVNTRKASRATAQRDR